MRPSAILTMSLTAVLTACTLKTQKTVDYLIPRTGLDIQTSSTPIKSGEWLIDVQTTTLFLTDRVQQLFDDTAVQCCQKAGFPYPHIVSQETGVRNSLTGGRRFARGVIHCSASPPRLKSR